LSKKKYKKYDDWEMYVKVFLWSLGITLEDEE
jgi:hypothetical protein